MNEVVKVRPLLERPRKDLTGQVFERLTVIGFDSWKVQPSGIRKGLWLCACECGNTLTVQQSNLLRNHTLSCGCYLEDKITKHGMVNSPEYRSHREMLNRCTNPKDTGFDYYGGRGIGICERWLEVAPQGFINFYEDMGPCNGLTLERIDVNKDYSPENCKWDTKSNQAYNTRIKSHNTSGRTGVSWSEERGKWTSQIGYMGEVISLGRFDTFEDAVKAREAAEIKYFGRNKE